MEIMYNALIMNYLALSFFHGKYTFSVVSFERIVKPNIYCVPNGFRFLGYK